ncbi:MAG TPA: hypothetical protein VFB78_18275 [Acidimicrobiales bacterium]|nr:hypothetical protein [Acidimicrobiales bacterium]
MKRRLAVALLLLSLPACARDHIEFRLADDFRVTAPSDQQRVRLPVQIRWKAADVKATDDLSGPGPFFAVFIDRAPIRAGTSLASLVDDDCRKLPGCPTRDWYAERFVFVTGDKTLTLPAVPADAGGTRTGADHTHRATVVVVNANGVRVNEAAASIDFAVVGT